MAFSSQFPDHVGDFANEATVRLEDAPNGFHFRYFNTLPSSRSPSSLPSKSFQEGLTFDYHHRKRNDDEYDDRHGNTDAESG